MAAVKRFGEESRRRERPGQSQGRASQEVMPKVAGSPGRFRADPAAERAFSDNPLAEGEQPGSNLLHCILMRTGSLDCATACQNATNFQRGAFAQTSVGTAT